MRMKHIKKIILTLGLLVGLTFGALGANRVLAAENPGNFSVQPILPSNQQPNVAGYFDLIVTNNQKQTLQIKLTNSSDKRTTFDVGINPAVTSDGGTIDYGQSKPRLDETLPFDLRDYVKLAQNKWSVPANTTITVPIQVSMPNLTFAGRVLGGIHVTKDSDSDSETKKDGVTIKNKIAYNIAIVLQQSTDKVAPDLKLLSGKPALINGYTNIQLHFQNPKATIIPDLIFTTKIYRDGKLYLENTSKKFLVAPNTNFHLNLDLDGDRIQPGSYKADEVNKNAIFKTKETDWWKIISLIAIGLLVILFIIFFIIFFKRRKKKDEENEN